MSKDLTDFKEKINRINLTRDLNKKQEIVNQLYEEKGVTDEVLELQLAINKTRAEENIPDPEERICKNFVQ